MSSKCNYFVVALFSLLAGCSSFNKQANNSDSKFTLEAADSIQLSLSHTEDLKRRFGNPSLVFNSVPTHTNALLYCDQEPCNEGHLTFHVDKESDIVKSVVWNPQRGDSNSLEAVLDHYKGVTFIRRRFTYNYGDYIDEVETYKNQELGITIGYDPYHKEVTQVFRQDPKAPLPVVASRSKFPIITELQDRDTAAIHESSSK
jgi:hypothetical protein